MLKKLIQMIIVIVIFTNITIPANAGVKYGLEYSNQVQNDNSVTFKDVTKNHWAYEYINEMVNRGILSGYPDGRFYPDNTISRAEFAKVMTTSAGLQISNDEITYYEDVKKSDWFRPYINVARPYLSGYTNPYSGNYYYPNQPILREDVGVALVKLKGYNTFGYDESMLNVMFTDVDSISMDARKYIAVAIEKGLMSGYEDRTFRGQSSVTRAEAAAMLWRAYQYGNNNKEFGMMKESIEISSTPIPVINSTIVEESVPTPKPTTTPSPELEKEYVVERITEVDKNNYMTYNSDENVVYYYKDDIINEYNVDNGEISEFIECGELKFPADDKGNYFTDLRMNRMYYDNYRNRLYITMTAYKMTDIGGLGDVELGNEESLNFYIANDEAVLLKRGNIFGTCEAGTIGQLAGAVYILDPDTGEVMSQLTDRYPIAAITVKDGKQYTLTESYNEYIPAELKEYDFNNHESLRSIAVASRYGTLNDDFYIWDIEGRIIKCDLNGDLSVLLNVNTDVKIKDMMSIKSYHNYDNFIITNDGNIIFHQDDCLRIIKES